MVDDAGRGRVHGGEAQDLRASGATAVKVLPCGLAPPISWPLTPCSGSPSAPTTACSCPPDPSGRVAPGWPPVQAAPMTAPKARARRWPADQITGCLRRHGVATIVIPGDDPLVSASNGARLAVGALSSRSTASCIVDTRNAWRHRSHPQDNDSRPRFKRQSWKRRRLRRRLQRSGGSPQQSKTPCVVRYSAPTSLCRKPHRRHAEFVNAWPIKHLARRRRRGRPSRSARPAPRPSTPAHPGRRCPARARACGCSSVPRRLPSTRPA